jgi:hypothetical protein
MQIDAESALPVPPARLTPKQLVVWTASVFLGLDVLAWFLFEPYSSSPWAYFAGATIGAQWGLTAIWLAFGWSPLWLRALSGALFGLFAEGALIHGNWFWPMLRLVLLAMAIALIPAIVARALRWQIRQFSDAARIAEWTADARPFQFTLRQMFAWTTAVAVLAALCRVLEPNKSATAISWFHSFLFGGFVVVVSAAALGRKYPLPKIGLCGIVAYCAETLDFFAIFNTPEFKGANLRFNPWLFGLRMPTEIVIIGCVLLLFRAQRFRFVRVEREALETIP